MIKALTFGMYSYISEGHIAFLEKARKLCDELVVALPFDAAYSYTARSDKLKKTGYVSETLLVDSVADCAYMVCTKKYDLYIYGSDTNKLELDDKSVFVDSGLQSIAFLVAVTGQACTLRCKDCGNFSPYAPKDHSFYNADEIVSDLSAILKYSIINTLQYQGGEPFLHPQLPELLKFAIGNDRINNCVLATNGTLIPNIDLSLLQHKKVLVRISDYPTVSKKAKILNAFCIENEIQNSVWRFASKKGMWHDLGRMQCVSERADANFKHCAFNGCLTLEDHRLGYCSRSTIAEAIQKFIPNEGDYLYIRDNPSFYAQLSNYLLNPHSMKACSYCNGTNNSAMIEPAIQLNGSMNLNV